MRLVAFTIVPTLDDLREPSRTFRSLPKASETFRRLPKPSEGFRNLPKASETFRRLPKPSEGFRNLPKASGVLVTCGTFWLNFFLKSERESAIPQDRRVSRRLD